MGRRGALGQPPAAWRERKRKWTRDARFTTLLLFETQRLRKLLFYDVLGTAGCWASGGTETKRNKRFSTRPSSGEGVAQSPSPTEQSPPSPGRPSQGLLHLRLPPGLAGAWTGWASCLRPAPRRCLVEGCCGCAGAGAAAEGAPTATSRLRDCSGVEAAGFLRRMMCLIASVCFCAAENCWAKLSTASRRGRSATREHSGNCTFSCSFMSARHSQRWRSWTTSCGHRTTQRLCGHLRRSKREVRRSTQFM